MNFSDNQMNGVPPQPAKSGWIKWLLIGCGGLIILAIIAAAGCFFAAKYALSKGGEHMMNAIETEMSSKLPEGADKAEFKQAFRTAVVAFKEGKISQSEIQTFSKLFDEAKADGKMDLDEFNGLIAYMNAASADKSEAEAP